MKSYVNVDICIQIGNVYEAFSRFLLDAISKGCPIICNDIGGNKEILDFGSGILLPQKPTINQIADAVKKIPKRFD